MAFPLRLQTHFCFISSKCLINKNRIDAAHTNSRFCTKCTLTPPKYDPVVVSKQPGNVYYQPTIWDYTFVESLQSIYKGDGYINQIEKLKKEATIMLEKAATPLAQLEMINVIQRLGMKYLFEEEIKEMLVNIYNDKPNGGMIYNLHATALKFMLLRQYGFKVSQDVFTIYMDKNGFKEHLSEDVKGMLSLYEAAHLAFEGESILEVAVIFTKTKLAEGINNDVELRNQVTRSLEIPLHWRMERSEARWYINEYKDAQDMNRVFLELAELNFNTYQATHQEDLRNMSRWWRSLGVASKLNFARDRLVGSLLFSVGISAEAKSQRCTEWLTKVMNFVLIIDDIYDVHGSLEELEIFANVVERWNTKEMEKLPIYMKICFLALYNTTNEMAFEVLKEQGHDILPYLTNSWANFIKAMLVEARWFNKGYTPSVEEYLSNGWLSSSGSVFLVHAFFATKQQITTDVLRALDSNHNLLYCSSMIFRLSNDLATSSADLERGDVSSSVHCYMREMSSSEEDARFYISGLIMDTWKKMNESIMDTTFDLPFILIALNLARTAIFFYQYGDGLGVEDGKTKDHVLSLIVNPI
ncbi:(-)-alpha-terpineol synthase-like [Papaver somniferum]|uniref:(-)-alpha-terpineol synthase-like n=1 Tax=Papaver somniferum TaxID=3469 RepID=UPI000E6FCFFE|nr:(-)-alpha-terpineol synthase-like [Papaver somniferum]